MTNLLLFAGASIVLAFTPGPDIIYVMTRGIAQGRRAALAAAAGFSLGNIVHTSFAALGISAILASSAQAFLIIKILGAGYLIYLGIKMLRAGNGIDMQQEDEQKKPARIFGQSIIANILNPKVAIFFLAFFPQFTDPEMGSVPLQMLTLGLVFIAITFVCFSTVGLAAGQIGHLLQARTNLSRRINQLAGSVLIALGLSLAWAKN